MKYLVISMNAFISTLAYKENLIVMILNRAIQISLSIFMWIAIFNQSNKTVIGGYTSREMTEYFIAAALLSLAFAFDPIFRISKQVQSGQLTTLLIRPIGLELENFFTFIGSKLLFIGAYLVVVGTLDLVNHTSLVTLVMQLVYFITSFVVFFQLIYLVGLLSFWIIQMWPLRPILSAVYMFAVGLLFPLTTLGKPVFTVIQYNVFSLVTNGNIQFLLGKFTHRNDYFIALLIQGILLHFVIERVFRSGLKKFEGMGT